MTGGALLLPPLEAVDRSTRKERIAALAQIGQLEERLRASLEHDDGAPRPTTRRVDPARVLSPKRAAALLGLSTYTVLEMLRCGELPEVKVRGRRGVRHVALVRWLEAREAAGLPPPGTVPYGVTHDTIARDKPGPARPRPRAKRAAGDDEPDTPAAAAFALPRGSAP